jgi:CHAD domain-containing protein
MPVRSSFRIQKNRKLNNSLSRIIVGQIDTATDLCKLPATNAEYAIHEIRKTMKRLRAVLRLTRFAIGEDKFNDENSRLREISFLFTDLRKSAAHLSSFSAIAEYDVFKNHPQLVTEIKNFLIKKKEEEYRKLSYKKNAMGKVMQLISGLKTRELFVEGKMDNISLDVLLLGLRKTYKSGHNRLHKAMKDPSVINNHNFRKSVKYLWYQLQLLRNIWPVVLGRYIIALDKIGEKFGSEHDLAELEIDLRENNVFQHKDLEYILSGIENIRKKFQQQVWPLAMRVYAESPGAFTRRIETYCKIYF